MALIFGKKAVFDEVILRGSFEDPSLILRCAFLVDALLYLGGMLLGYSSDLNDFPACGSNWHCCMTKAGCTLIDNIPRSRGNSLYNPFTAFMSQLPLYVIVSIRSGLGGGSS